ncbi:hypothetical protein ACFPPD_03695 [Cohnella suwonensis]|uniref:Uncharacterized protein n=1 Tax=Cohnella suwonensis TaxID=696072 RepID=A0ABW0LQ14_9BACL
MEKRLNRSDLMFSLSFILMLVIAVGAFFYGVKVGTDRVEAKYAEAAEEPAAAQEAQPFAYQQQDLVSFYHTVFLSYREFQNEWLADQDKWLADPTLDRAATLKDLAKLSQKKYDQIGKVAVSPVSPQLKEAQTSYMKSLKLFHDSFGSLADKANQGNAQMALDKVEADAFYKQALSHSLTAQQQYFGSMLKWAATIDTNIPDDIAAEEAIAISKWKTYPLVVKLKVASDYMAKQPELTEYLPSDLTARVDQFIVSGQASKRNAKSFNAIAELLTSTEAVRNGDFVAMKARFYEQEQLPQLPFFFSDK